jgi:hypothetical protein
VTPADAEADLLRSALLAFELSGRQVLSARPLGVRLHLGKETIDRQLKALDEVVHADHDNVRWERRT